MLQVDTEVQEKNSAYNLEQKLLNSSLFCPDSFKTEDRSDMFLPHQSAILQYENPRRQGYEWLKCNSLYFFEV
jgi:hypothetical protein